MSANASQPDKTVMPTKQLSLPSELAEPSLMEYFDRLPVQSDHLTVQPAA